MKQENEEILYLIKNMKEGSFSAFNEFYEKFVPLVYRVAFHILKDQMDAEDVCHDVFIEVLNKINQYDPNRGSIEAWLVVKTRSRSLDKIRKKQKNMTQYGEVKESSFGSQEGLEEEVVKKIDGETVFRAIKNIPKPQQQAILGTYVQNYTHKELAEKMNRPLGTIKSLIRYGIHNLKKQLVHSGWIESSGGANKHGSSRL